MELEDLIGKSGLSGKEKRKGKAKAMSHACRAEVQKVESRNSKKAMDMTVGFCTRLLLDEQWLKLVKEKNRSGQLEQALCDVNELIRIIGKLKTRHSFLPGIESKALREKISISVKLGYWTEVTSGLELMIRRYPEQSYTKDSLFLATIYLSRILHGSMEHDLKPHFSPEKAFACIMECLQCKSEKSEEFYEDFPEYRHLLDGLLDLKSNSGKRTRELFSRCKEALDSCKNPNEMFDLVILPCISAHMHIHRGNADLAMDAIRQIKDLSPTLANYYLARLSKLKKEMNAALWFYKSLVSKGVPVYKELLHLFIELKDFKLAAATAFAAEHFYNQHHCVREAAYWGLLAEEYDREEKAASEREAQKLKAQQRDRAEAQTQEKVEESIPTDKEADAVSKEPSKVESKPPLMPMAVKPKTRKPEQPFQSAEDHYYQAQSMIREYKYDSRSTITEKDISDKFKEALHDSPDDLWLRHSSGWWHFEQNEHPKAKEDLLRGLQIALGRKPTWNVPMSNQQQRALIRMILSMFIEPFEKRKASMDPEAYKYQARDIAAFLSAYAHILVEEGLTDEASQFRNVADRLDDRRGAKALDRLKTLIEPKIKLITQEAFEQSKKASLSPV